MTAAARTSMRRTRTTAVLSALMCVIALLAPSTATAAAGHARAHLHAATIVAAATVHLHAPALRPDQPHLLSPAVHPRHSVAVARVTATSATITTSRTVDSPRMRGPPMHGCS